MSDHGSVDRQTTGLRGGRKGPGTDKYAAGWLQAPEPAEDLVRLGGFAWSELFVGAQTKRIYKQIKNTGEWFRFAIVVTDETAANIG